MCVTNEPELARRLRRLREYGFEGGERHAREEGVNSRLDELQAAILRVRLRHLGESLGERRRLAAGYERALAGSAVALVRTRPLAEHALHLLVVRCAAREKLVAELERRGIGHGIHYPVPAHRMTAYAFLGYGQGALPVTECAAREVLSLPLYEGLPLEAVADVAAAVRAAAGSR
jgi:aminotransferase EvaB